MENRKVKDSEERKDGKRKEDIGVNDSMLMKIGIGKDSDWIIIEEKKREEKEKRIIEKEKIEDKSRIR